MVRVGGGWADLADYLRQYADHHGSRTVSEGNIDVQKVSGSRSRVASGAADNKARAHASVALTRDTALDGDQGWLDQEQPKFSMGDVTPPDESSPMQVRQRTPTQASASRTASLSHLPQQSTAGYDRPSSRQDGIETSGLAGPSSGKKNSLSEHKAKWVEGMLERAKTASAEKAKDEKEKYFGEIGKAGGTRRVIFRSSSGMGNRT